MLKSIIVDDEIKSCESLSILLQDFCEGVKVVATCQKVDEAFQAIKTHKPDVVFLDIHMQRETGFDLLERFDQINFSIIFITAYSEYAIKAFKFSAVDYLLKPVDVEELRASVARVRQTLKKDITEKLEQLVHNLKPNSPQMYRLALPLSDGLFFIKVSDVLYCEADSNYTKIHMADGKQYLVSRTLKEYDDLLSEHDFFRIHNSYLVNLNQIKNYVRGDGGYVVMVNDKSLDVSKRKKEAFLKRIGY